MRKLKIVLSVAVVLILCMLLCACGGTSEAPEPTAEPSPTATASPTVSPAPTEEPVPSEEPIPLRSEAELHQAYLPLDSDGRFFPEEPVSRAKAVELIAWCLDPEYDLEGKALIKWEAEQALLALNLIEPIPSKSAPITRYEFYQILERLCGHQDREASFEDVRPGSPMYSTFQTAAANGWLPDGAGVRAYPNKALTRRDAARALNQILQRSVSPDQSLSLVGTIPDVACDDPDFWVIAEASVEHSHGDTTWLDSSPAPSREPGFYFLDGRLHAIDESGSPVISAEYLGLTFNESGEQTSGSEELDELVLQTLEPIVDFETMSRDEMLKAVFNYVGNRIHYSYLGRGHYERGSTGWEVEAATIMLKTHRGNCYNFAAAFWALARALGYDATAYSGSIAGRTDEEQQAWDGGRPLSARRDHGWVEIDVDGEPRIFDVEMAFTQPDSASFFGMGEEGRARYRYQVGD